MENYIYNTRLNYNISNNSNYKNNNNNNNIRKYIKKEKLLKDIKGIL